MERTDLPNPPFVIGVAGGSGSGKTTISTRIRSLIGSEHIAYLQHDSYYRDHGHLSPAERALCNYDHPASLDTPLLVQHIHALCRGETVQVPIYDFATHTRSPITQPLAPAPVILVEGILLFVDPTLRELLDLRIYVDTDPDIRLIRRLHRDMTERGRTLDSVISQYLRTVRPMHQEFVEPSKRHADIVIPEGGDNTVALEIIAIRIRAVLDPR
jgi:uridine kinase